MRPPECERVGDMLLLRQIERHLAQTRMPWTKFGRIVAHDPRLVSDLRNGRQPRAALAARIRAYIAAHDAAVAAGTPTSIPSQQENHHAL